MNRPEPAHAYEVESAALNTEKRVILSMGGKGGVGKTSVMVGLAEWFEANEIPVKLLDLDTENKARGSLAHFFSGAVPKVNIHTPAGLDSFVDQLADGPPVILADMGAGAGQVTYDWFERMYPDVSAAGIVFTAIGIVTADPASVESVLAWGAQLQDRVEYLIVENGVTENSDFTYWRESEQALRFQKVFHNENLRQQFVQSTIPETGQALTVAAAQVKRSTAEFAQAARDLGNAYSGALEEARKAIAKLESTSSHAIASVERCAANANHIFERGNRWSLYVLLSLALVAGIGLEKACQLFVSPPQPQIECAPVVQPPLPSGPHVKSKTKH